MKWNGNVDLCLFRTVLTCFCCMQMQNILFLSQLFTCYVVTCVFTWYLCHYIILLWTCDSSWGDPARWTGHKNRRTNKPECSEYHPSARSPLINALSLYQAPVTWNLFLSVIHATSVSLFKSSLTPPHPPPPPPQSDYPEIRACV